MFGHIAATDPAIKMASRWGLEESKTTWVKNNLRSIWFFHSLPQRKEVRVVPLRLSERRCGATVASPEVKPELELRLWALASCVPIQTLHLWLCSQQLNSHQKGKMTQQVLLVWAKNKGNGRLKRKKGREEPRLGLICLRAVEWLKRWWLPGEWKVLVMVNRSKTRERETQVEEMEKGCWPKVGESE